MQPNVGPGSYTINRIDHKPQSMFLPRSGLRNTVQHYNSGSVRDNFELDGEIK